MKTNKDYKPKRTKKRVVEAFAVITAWKGSGEKIFDPAHLKDAFAIFPTHEKALKEVEEYKVGYEIIPVTITYLLPQGKRT